MFGEGPLTAVGVMVGEGPGRDEAERGRPFIGPTGMELENSILQAHLRRSDLFIVNAMLCQPPVSRSLKMMRDASNCCRPALIAQLSKFRRDIPILAMGKWAFFALTGKTKGLKNARGFVREFSLDRTQEVEDAFSAKQTRQKKKKAGSPNHSE